MIQACDDILTMIEQEVPCQIQEDGTACGLFLSQKVMECFLRHRKHLRIKSITHHLQEQVKQVRCITPLEAKNHPTLQVIYNFFIRKYSHYPEVRALRRELFLKRLCVDPVVLRLPCNQGFEEFAKKYYLDRYLSCFDHTLHVDEEGRICLPSAQGLRPWKEAKRLLDQLEGDPFIWGDEGVRCDTDIYKWDHLKPFKKGEAQASYVLKCCFCCQDKKDREQVPFRGDHSWIELMTPEGEMISVGLYRPEKNEGWFNVLKFLPLEKKRGRLQQPDISEVFPTPIYTISKEIAKEQYEAIIRSIEEDKQREKEGQLSFQLMENNCVRWIQSKAALADLHFSASTNIWQCLLPTRVSKGLLSLSSVSYLKTAMKVLYVSIGVPTGNFLMLSLGASKVDPSLQGKDAKPYIKSWWNIFDSTKLEFTPPTIVPLQVEECILERR